MPSLNKHATEVTKKTALRRLETGRYSTEWRFEDVHRKKFSLNTAGVWKYLIVNVSRGVFAEQKVEAWIRIEFEAIRASLLSHAGQPLEIVLTQYSRGPVKILNEFLCAYSRFSHYSSGS
jgi:hypothetical protein